MSSLWSCGFQVRISDGPDKGRTFPLDAAEITVGRARHQGDRAPGWILLNDPKVSRIHLDLAWNESKKTYQMCHRSETNNTFLNRVPMAVNVSQDLKVGDLIRLGDSEIDIQQADFRFGGIDPLQASAMSAHSRAPRNSAHIPVLSAYDSKLDNEKSGSTKKASRRAALTLRPNFHLEVLHGPGAGSAFPVNGMKLMIGGPHPFDAVPPKTKTWDQEVVLDDASIPEYYLSLNWRELENGFELVRTPNQPQGALQLERRVDGFVWTGQLAPDEAASVRGGDILALGELGLQLAAPPEGE